MEAGREKLDGGGVGAEGTRWRRGGIDGKISMGDGAGEGGAGEAREKAGREKLDGGGSGRNSIETGREKLDGRKSMEAGRWCGLDGGGEGETRWSRGRKISMEVGREREELDGGGAGAGETRWENLDGGGAGDTRWRRGGRNSMEAGREKLKELIGIGDWDR